MKDDITDRVVRRYLADQNKGFWRQLLDVFTWCFHDWEVSSNGGLRRCRKCDRCEKLFHANMPFDRVGWHEID
jgi:hypothetical protein